MKSVLLGSAIVLSAGVLTANASSESFTAKEDVAVKLDIKKFNTAIPAPERFEMLERLAERTCDTRSRTLQDLRIETRCEAEFKRSILAQVGDDDLKAVARKHNVL